MCSVFLGGVDASRTTPWSIWLYAGDIGGEEVDAVAVEVAAGAVVVLRGAWVGVPGPAKGLPRRGRW
jgi:hypothetical protein